MARERTTAHGRRGGPAIRPGRAARVPPDTNDRRSGLLLSPLSAPFRLASQRLQGSTARLWEAGGRNKHSAWPAAARRPAVLPAVAARRDARRCASAATINSDREPGTTVARSDGNLARVRTSGPVTSMHHCAVAEVARRRGAGHEVITGRSRRYILISDCAISRAPAGDYDGAEVMDQVFRPEDSRGRTAADSGGYA